MSETTGACDGKDDRGGAAKKERVRLTGLSARAFEHPADRAALSALRRIPGFDMALRKLLGLLGERSLRTLYLASSVRTNEKQFAKVDRLYRECLEILDLRERPELFVSQTPFVNAGAIGVEHPFVVVNSGTLSLLSDDELRFILGHELGHILADHALFKTMLLLLIRFSLGGLGIPLGALALYGILAGLLEWDRKSELSADRAGLLCCQEPEVAYRAFMKLAGGPAVDQMDTMEFVRQANEYKTGGDALDSIYKILNLLGQQHPFHVLRLAELKEWTEGGELERILAGSYPRRGTEEKSSLRDEFVRSAQSYKKAYAESKDPLVQFLKDFGEKARETGKDVWSKIRDGFSKPE